MKEFSVAGYKQGDFTPTMVKSLLGQTSDSSLLDIKFEMNPLDKRCDQCVDVIAKPLQIVYDAETVIQLLQVFKVPSNANLSEYDGPIPQNPIRNNSSNNSLQFKRRCRCQTI